MGECGTFEDFKIEEEHIKKSQVVRHNHKIKIGGEGVIVKDILKNRRNSERVNYI